MLSGSPFSCCCETKVALLVMLTPSPSSLQALDQPSGCRLTSTSTSTKHHTSTHARTHARKQAPSTCSVTSPLTLASLHHFPLLPRPTTALPRPATPCHTLAPDAATPRVLLGRIGRHWQTLHHAALPGQDEMRWDEARELASFPTPLSNAPGQPRPVCPQLPPGWHMWPASTCKVILCSPASFLFFCLCMDRGTPSPWTVRCTDGLHTLARGARCTGLGWAGLGWVG